MSGGTSFVVKGRALHFVLKIGNRRANYDFFTKVLGMQILRHEEFEEGCKAACNGPYDGKWSKTMVGYGSEDNHFVVELTYNYSVRDYKLGNDLKGLTIADDVYLKIVQSSSYPKTEDNGVICVESPDGYKFYVTGNNSHSSQNLMAGPVKTCTLAVSNLETSLKYWKDFLQMSLVSHDEGKEAVLTYSSDRQCYLKLVQADGAIDHATAFGRIAFSVPEDQVKVMEDRSKEGGHTILVPYVKLDTPGKSAVRVVILADPDGHEICFVGDEGFRDLSQIQSDADKCINEAMDKDKSDEWIQRMAAMNAK